MNEILNIKSLDIGYFNSGKAATILSNLNLSAYKGELIALIGINGSGKSTLLKTLLSFIPKIKGDIYISGKEISKIDIKEKAKKLSFVSTEVIRIQNFKVKDMVALGRFPHTNWLGKLTEEDKIHIEKSLEMIGISHKAEKYINEISDGERQKVMIARTLAQNTDIILLDEPTAFLDLKNKYQLISNLYKLTRNENKLIIFSSHDINIALKLCDKIWMVKDNSIISESPEDLILNEHFSQIFRSNELIFNKNTFDFDFVYEKKYPVKVINKSKDIYFSLTIKALERNSYFLSEEGLFEIEILNNNYSIEWKINDEKIFSTIEELILFLNSKHL